MVTKAKYSDAVKLEDLNKQTFYLCGKRVGICSAREYQEYGKFYYCLDKGTPCSCRSRWSIKFSECKVGITP
jgi:hypothetical protein